MSGVAADDSIGRAGVVEGRLGQAEEDDDGREWSHQERPGDHRDDGGVEAVERHVAALAVVLLDRGGDDDDDGDGASDGRHVRQHDAEATGGRLVDDDHGVGDDGDINDGRLAVADVVHGEPADLPRSAKRRLKSHLHHRDVAEDNLAHAAHRGDGAVIEEISGLRDRRRRRCHD